MQQHLLSTKQVFASSQLENLFKEADFLRDDPWSSGCDPVVLARGKVLGIIKDEGSTRTRISFEVAMKRLGGDTVLLELDNNCSISKGESIEDTIRTVSEYVDVIIMRHSKKRMVQHCANFSQVPIINAGDGDGEHPTQALLDVYTIYREKGRLDNLDIMLVGDLKYGRTIHSLLHLLSLYPNNRIKLISPTDMKIPKEYIPEDIQYSEYSNLSLALAVFGKNLDILYMTRLQKERYLTTKEMCDSYLFSSSNYYTLKDEDIKSLSPTCRVLHPLPRNSEIPTSFDADTRAVYFHQVQNGMYIRMALLNNLFRKKDLFSRSLTKV